MKSLQTLKSNGRMAGVFTLMFAAFLLLFLPGCQGPLGQQDESATGTVSLTIGSGFGRAIMPDFGSDGYTLESFNAFSAVFTRGTQRIYGVVDGTTITAVLSAGGAPWTLTVTAYLDADDDYPAAQAILGGIVVNPGPNNDLGQIVLRPILEGEGEGTFSWEIAFPANVVSGAIVITGGDAPITVPLPATPVSPWGDELPLDVGSYFMVVMLRNAEDLVASVAMDLHVFQNMESHFDFEFVPGNFFVPSEVSGTLADFLILDGFTAIWQDLEIVEGGRIGENADAVGPLSVPNWINEPNFPQWVARDVDGTPTLSLRVGGGDGNHGLRIDTEGFLEPGDIVVVTGRAITDVPGYAGGDGRAMQIVTTGAWIGGAPQVSFANAPAEGYFPFTLTAQGDWLAAAIAQDSTMLRVQVGNDTETVDYFYIDSITVTRQVQWAHGPLVIYRGGPNPNLGLRHVGLADALHTFMVWQAAADTRFTEIWDGWDENFEMNHDVGASGLDGRTTAIRFSRGTSPDGRQGFGLALAEGETFDMDGVVALSFWARAAGTVNVGMFGFGDPVGYDVGGWLGTHSGVVYSNHANNAVANSFPLGPEWRRFVIPIPEGITSMDAINRVFTFKSATAGFEGAVPALYLDNIEFLTSGVTLTGLFVPAAVADPFEAGVDVDFSARFADGAMWWEFDVVGMDAPVTISMHPNIANLAPVWTFENPHNRFTVVEVTGADASLVDIVDEGRGVNASAAAADVQLILENGLGQRTNPVAITFVGELEYLALGNFYGLTGAIAGNVALGYWASAWRAGFEGEVNGRHALFFMRAAGFSGVGRNYQDWNISGFDYISFWVRDGGNAPVPPNPTPPHYSAYGQTYRFFLQGPGAGAAFEFGTIPGFEFTIGAEHGDWTEVRIPLVPENFVNATGDHPDLTNIRGWRFHLPNPIGANADLGTTTNPAILIADIFARRGDIDDNGY
ncbi:MAG: hypothetical protein FWB78_08730 [Treponema sp.]|nr:hypothetical protein [Treponema sp.]